MRQSFRLTASLGAASKFAFRSGPVSRAIHTARPANNFFTARSTTSISSLSKVRNAFQQSRTYMGQQQTAGANNSEVLKKLAVGGALFGGTLVAINAIFNRETREDGGMPAYERAYLNATFAHTGLGIGIIGVAARAMYQSGFVYRLMATNPWVVMIGGLAFSFGTMYGTRATDPDK